MPKLKAPEQIFSPRKGVFVMLSPEALQFLKDAAAASGLSQGHVVESALRMLSSRKLQGESKSKKKGSK